MMFNSEFLLKIKELLLSERELISGRPSAPVDVDMEGDDTDEVQGKMILELQGRLTSITNAKLSQINDALKRLEDGTYGACLECECKINERRLEKNPHYTVCVVCAENQENEMKNRRIS